jgi:hypothetical protein
VNLAYYQYFRTAWDGEKLKLQNPRSVRGLSAPGYTIAAVGDFDGDGDDDLLQQGIEDLKLRICIMDGFTLRQCVSVTPETFHHVDYTNGWAVAGPR